ncbi:MAG: phosphoribosylanthranilate isomerase [Xanthomonadales bacterium]|nr:phosphoribosylanthranilate isomerase [Xanthomonadales bacterium]
MGLGSRAHPLPGRIQIAGVIDQAEADLITASGADMLGFPLGLKDGREDLSIDKAAAIVRALPDHVTAVCITYLDKARDVLNLCARLAVPWVQLHGRISAKEVQQLRASDPDLGIIKSLIVRPGAELLTDVRTFELLVDAFITDTFDAETGRSGATGKTHDWAISREIVRATDLPVVLAGGLTPDNVAEAIANVRPAAVDAHTGVEGRDGRKLQTRIHNFACAASAAFAMLEDHSSGMPRN